MNAQARLVAIVTALVSVVVVVLVVLGLRSRVGAAAAAPGGSGGSGGEGNGGGGGNGGNGGGGGAADPSAVFCEQQGGKFEIEKDEKGNERGVCVLPGGQRCGAWAFYRGECGPNAGKDVVLPACASDPKWPKDEAAAAKIWATVEVAARKRINQFKASRSIAPISGVAGDGWKSERGPYWRWVLEQSLAPAFAVAKITSGPCLWEGDEFSPMGKRLAVLADDVAATVGDAP